MTSLKVLSMLCLAAAAVLASHGLVMHPDSAPNRSLRKYTISLNARLYALQRAPHGLTIALGQAAALAITALVAAAIGPNPWFLLALVITLSGPQVFIMRALRKRRIAIEQQLNSFGMALANALRASPNLGKALERAEAVATGALAEELGIVLRELRLGATVDQSLLNLAGRVGSVSLDAIVSALLIGRQVGGHISQILETTASTLREMERLDALIRTKTSEAKGQLSVMALAPPFVFVAFDHLQPGYFNPLTESPAGLLVLGFAVMAWFASVILARRILALEI